MKGYLKKQEFDGFMLSSNLKRSITRLGLTVSKRNDSAVIILSFAKKAQKNAPNRTIGPASWDLVKKGYEILKLWNSGAKQEDAISTVLKTKKVRIIPDYLKTYAIDVFNNEKRLKIMGEDLYQLRISKR